MTNLNAYLTCPLFHLKDMRSFREIALLLDLHEAEFPAGSVILERGMPSKDVMIVLSGTVEEMAGEVIQRQLSKNSCFAMTLALTQNRSALTYLAKTECLIGYAPISALKKYDELLDNVTRLLAKEAEETISRLAVLTQKNAKEKVRRYLEEQSRLHHNRTFIIPLKRKEIAAFLGITPTALYLELKELEASGRLKVSHSTYQLLR